MAEVILMPRLSDTMTEGVIAAWHKKIGDPVKKGDLLAEIDTDKATMELESYKDGTLLHMGGVNGSKIDVDQLLAIIGSPDEDISSLIGGTSSSSAAIPAATPASEMEATAPKESLPAAVTTVADHYTETSNGRLKASPLAKKLASEKGIDLNTVQGSGDGGRIVKADINTYKPSVATASPEKLLAPAPVFAAISGEEGYTDIPNSQIRNVIAKRLSESKLSAPHFYLTMEINMDNAIAARTQLNEIGPVKISFNDLVVKAAAMALRQHATVNSSWMGDKIRRNHHIHIGIAVAVEDGLIVPVIKFADQKDLPQIASESKELIGKARNKKLQPPEFTGNTFTISNLGMMNIEEFTAIINPPDSCIMAVGRIKEVVQKKGDGFGVSHLMKVTLSCDHRSVDGATGAAFLQSFKKYLENPISLFFPAQ